MFGLKKRIAALEKALGGIKADIRAVEAPSIPPYDDSEVWDAIESLAKRLDDMTHAVAEGIERVDRSERRVKAVVQRAKKRLEDAGFTDDGVEAEAEQLRLLDGAERDGSGVPPVHQGMGGGQGLDLSAFPGQWGDSDVAALVRARG